MWEVQLEYVKEDMKEMKELQETNKIFLVLLYCGHLVYNNFKVRVSVGSTAT